MTNGGINWLQGILAQKEYLIKQDGIRLDSSVSIYANGNNGIISLHKFYYTVDLISLAQIYMELAELENFMLP